MNTPQISIFLALSGLLLGTAIAFGITAFLLRRQLLKIGTLPDLNKKLRAREVQLSMMRSTADERREQVRQLLDELELQSEETITCLLLEDLALETLSELEGKSVQALRSELVEEMGNRNHRRPRTEFSSLDAIARRLEMIRNCRSDLGLPTDSCSLPFPRNTGSDESAPERELTRH